MSQIMHISKKKGDRSEARVKGRQLCVCVLWGFKGIWGEYWG